MKRYEEALLQAQEFEKLNYRYDEVSKTKQTVSWINLWYVYMRLYVGLAEYDKAEIYDNKIDGEGKPPFVLNDFYSMRSHNIL